jgi:hypothetical protein
MAEDSLAASRVLLSAGVDGGQNANDGDDEEQLDEREATIA